jgi:hypothetical protein
MKKISRITITVFIVLCFTFVSVSTVYARRPTPVSIAWTDPFVVTTDKSVTFTSDVLTPWQLPGTQTLKTGQYVPVGFPIGEAQFGGNGLQVSDLPDGRLVTLCFDFPVYANSWHGTIYEWSGTKWVAMPTTLIQATDSTPAYACTFTAGNGIYALIIGFYGTPQPKEILR